ncbi:helix-turn-helix domain-containing protein [Rhodopseudomonas palustris]|uniref:helix-turn-helix domain-containing protein n=1 Tax=Rhodopseudomonas palustris TaxID=1076 RepID=UPI003A5BEE17
MTAARAEFHRLQLASAGSAVRGVMAPSESIAGRRTFAASRFGAGMLAHKPKIECSVVRDIVPDQRRREARDVRRLSSDAESVAIRRALAGFARARAIRPTDNALLQLRHAVSEAFKVDEDEIFSPSLALGVTRIRQIAMMLGCVVTSAPRGEVGRRMCRDRSTAWYAEKRLQHLIVGMASTIGQLGVR